MYVSEWEKLHDSWTLLFFFLTTDNTFHFQQYMEFIIFIEQIAYF